MKQTTKTYAFWILLTLAVGALSGYLSREGTMLYAMMEKPPLAPPGILFPIVWGILYTLMGISAARIWLAQDSVEKRWGINIYLVQLAVNFFWSLIFFNAQAYGAAFIWLLLLWVLIVAVIWLFSRVDRTAALLQIPYLLWVTFAAYLNYSVWQLNS